MNFTISRELLQAIADYLTERPYKEVVGLLQGISTLQPQQEVKSE